MEVIYSISEIRQRLKQVRALNKRIGVVPTMGALHQGHMSLVRRIKPHCDYLVMWIFLNPTQFNSIADYEKYPRVLDEDCRLAADSGVDLVFAPKVEDIYPSGLHAYTERRSCRVTAGGRSWELCGDRRPGHFDGVVHIVSVLFNLIQPDIAVFGEKDYQQLRVIEQLVQDLHYNIEIIAAPLIRDESGLALSSRNKLLAEGADAPLSISRALLKAKDLVAAGECSAAAITDMVRREMEQTGLIVDYVEICDTETLRPLEHIERQAQLLVAAFAGQVRLIDNLRLECQK